MKKCHCMQCDWEGPETDLIIMRNADEDFAAIEACPECWEVGRIVDVLDDD